MTGDEESAVPPPLRASDHDREVVVERLRTACEEGRLTLEETTERIGAAYQASTFAALEPLTADLPASTAAVNAANAAALGAASPAVVPDAGRSSESYVAIFGGTERKGRWRVPRRSKAVAVFGGITLDLRESQLAASTVDIDAVAVFGGIEIAVPEGVDVQLSGWAVFGGKSAKVPTAPPGAPVIRVKAIAVFGGVDVKVKHDRDWKKVATDVRQALKGQ